MMIAEMALLILSIVLIALSAWNYSRLILFSLFMWMLLEEIDLYTKSSQYDYLNALGKLTVFCLFFYMINMYKIMNRNFFDFVKHGEFKAFLEENNAFSGYNKFIYYFPGLIFAQMALYIVIYYFFK